MSLTASRLRIVLILAIAALIAGATIGGYFALGYLRGQIREVNRIKIDAEVSSEAEASAVQTKRELQEEEISQLLDYMKQIIPDAHYRTQFLADVKKYADESNISISGITFGDAPAQPGQPAKPAVAGNVRGQPIPVTITLGAGISYTDVISLVKKLENNLQYIQILRLTLQPNSTNPAVLSTAALDVQLYVKNRYDMKTSISLSLSKISLDLQRMFKPPARHFYFMYLLFLLLSIGICVALIALTFSEDDQAYREQKTQESLQDVRLNKDTKVVDRVLQLQTANAGPIKPNYVPSRDNPFIE